MSVLSQVLWPAKMERLTATTTTTDVKVLGTLPVWNNLCTQHLLFQQLGRTLKDHLIVLLFGCLSSVKKTGCLRFHGDTQQTATACEVAPQSLQANMAVHAVFQLHTRLKCLNNKNIHKQIKYRLLLNCISAAFVPPKSSIARSITLNVLCQTNNYTMTHHSYKSPKHCLWNSCSVYPDWQRPFLVFSRTIILNFFFLHLSPPGFQMRDALDFVPTSSVSSPSTFQVF